ncbi:hypothetical protein G3M48_010257, partial [Beauveria asiatica]
MSVFARSLNIVSQRCWTVYVGARRLKSSASHRSRARNPPTATGIAAMVSALSKTPNHLSVIFDVGVSTDDMNLEKIIQQAAELAAWSVAAGISTVSIYDTR